MMESSRRRRWRLSSTRVRRDEIDETNWADGGMGRAELRAVERASDRTWQEPAGPVSTRHLSRSGLIEKCACACVCLVGAFGPPRGCLHSGDLDVALDGRGVVAPEGGCIELSFASFDRPTAGRLVQFN